MSIVIVTHDKFSPQRESTRSQEAKITTDGDLKKWRLSNIDKPSIVMKVLALAALPIIGAWSLILLGMGFAFTIVGIVIKGLGKIFR